MAVTFLNVEYFFEWIQRLQWPDNLSVNDVPVLHFQKQVPASILFFHFDGQVFCIRQGEFAQSNHTPDLRLSFELGDISCDVKRLDLYFLTGSTLAAFLISQVKTQPVHVIIDVGGIGTP